VFVIELDLGHLEAPAPPGLVPQTTLKRPLRVLLTEVYVDRLGVAGLERGQARQNSLTGMGPELHAPTRRPKS
jgi:hypothetical protein